VSSRENFFEMPASASGVVPFAALKILSGMIVEEPRAGDSRERPGACYKEFPAWGAQDGADGGMCC